MTTQNTKARLDHLEQTLIPKAIITQWWIVKALERKGEEKPKHYATCEGVSYTREEHETEEDFINRIKAVPRPLLPWRIMVVTTRPKTENPASL